MLKINKANVCKHITYVWSCELTAEVKSWLKHLSSLESTNEIRFCLNLMMTWNPNQYNYWQQYWSQIQLQMERNQPRRSAALSPLSDDLRRACPTSERYQAKGGKWRRGGGWSELLWGSHVWCAHSYHHGNPKKGPPEREPHHQHNAKAHTANYLTAAGTNGIKN